jgi:hypothetical protein
MKYEIKSISTGYSESGYLKKTHIITFWGIYNSKDLKSALSKVDEVIYEDLYVEQVRSQHDCSGRYSTSEIEKVHRSFDHNTLLVICNEFGSYDI